MYLTRSTFSNRTMITTIIAAIAVFNLVLPLSARAAVIYDFESDTIGATPAGTTVGAGTFDVQVDDLMGKSMRAATQVGVIAALNFTNFASSSDYSVSWRQAYSDNMARGGFTLRSQSTDTGVANSAGAKMGYLFQVYDSSALYVWRVTSGSYVMLWSGSLAKAEPRWFKAMVVGNNLRFYYSNDGSSYTLLASTTDSVYSSGFVQYTAGYGLGVAKDYIDDVTITSIDGVAPVVSSLDPADNSTGVNINSNFKISFNETVATTSIGNIYLKKRSDNSTVETIAATSTKITASSTNAFVINPATTLAYSTDYYFQIDSGVFVDESANNFAGISATSTWNFTTESAPAPEPEPDPEPSPSVQSTPASTPHPGTSTSRRISNLISMGKYQEAQALMASIGTAISSTSPNVRDLELGMTGDDVMSLQKLLNALGFPLATTGVGSIGNETSYFGTMTRDALAKYQSANGISPKNGYFGSITRNKIKSGQLLDEASKLVWW